MGEVEAPTRKTRARPSPNVRLARRPPGCSIGAHGNTHPHRATDRKHAQGPRRDRGHFGILGWRPHLGGATRRARRLDLLSRGWRHLHAQGIQASARPDTGRYWRHALLDRALCPSAGQHHSRQARRRLGALRNRRLRPNRQWLWRRPGPHLHRRSRPEPVRDLHHFGDRPQRPPGKHAPLCKRDAKSSWRRWADT